jgi:hypothetical protein
MMWHHYGDHKVARLRRSPNGSIAPIINNSHKISALAGIWVSQDDNGNLIIPDQHTCFNQRLMHGDHGMETPNG